MQTSGVETLRSERESHRCALPIGLVTFPEARCLDTDPELFHPDARDLITAARVAQRYCQPCSHRAECAALAKREKHVGIWGGLLLGLGRPIDLLRYELRPPSERDGGPKCGTRNGAGAHRRKREEPCERCAAAEKRYFRDAARLRVARRRRAIERERAS